MTTEAKLIKNKLGLLNLAEMLGNVSPACNVMGYSRDRGYRFKERYEPGGELALRAMSKKKPMVENRVAPDMEEAVVSFALEQPAYGQWRVANELNKVAQEGLMLTEGQRRALEKAKEAQEAHEGDRQSASGRLAGAGHRLRRHAQGRWAPLAADGDRHRQPSSLRHAV